MKDSTETVGQRVGPLKALDWISWNFVVMKDIMFRCGYPQDILIHFFFWERAMPFFIFKLRNLTKMKDTTDTVGKHNSTETAQQNCVKFCSYEGHNV